MTPGKRWADEELPLGAIRERQDLQFRAGGLSLPHINKLMRALGGEGADLEPVRVARIGKALCLVDGFHRLEAHRRAGRGTIKAKVARMSLGEAKDAARVANVAHGRSLNGADKALVWQSYLADGRHLEADGSVKSSRTIAGELGQLYSHETVRQKLKAHGVELNEEREFPGGYKPRDREEDEDQVAEELAEELEDQLRRFGEGFSGLPDWHRPRLLRAAQGMLEALLRGEAPNMPRLLAAAAEF